MARKLGRGLESLIPTGNEELLSPDRSVSIDLIRANPNQPRKYFEPEALAELGASIREHGIIQPLIVTETEDGGFEVIAGERRLQAARLVGLTEVPIVIRSATEQEKLELAVIENVQRRDLSPMEEARAYRKLMDEFNLTQEQVADKVGKSRVAVSNTVRLLHLPPEVIEGVEKSKLTEGHARAILGAPPEEQVSLYREVVEKGLSVRETERAAKSHREERRSPEAPKERLTRVEDAIRERVGAKVTVTSRSGRGSIKIDYHSEEELERLLDTLGIVLE